VQYQATNTSRFNINFNYFKELIFAGKESIKVNQVIKRDRRKHLNLFFIHLFIILFITVVLKLFNFFKFFNVYIN